MKLVEDLGVRCNFHLELREHGKLKQTRDGHNVFTETGSNWLTRLSAWSTIGATDVPFTNRRVRWMGLGTGTQSEVASVSNLVTPAQVTSGVYLGAIQNSNPLTTNSIEFVREFSTTEVSLVSLGLNVVAVSEAGLFVDVQPASSSTGTDDSSAGGATDSTLDPSASLNAPIAYKTFEPLNKTADFSLVIRWTLTF